MAGTELFEGEHVFTANEKVIDVLKEQGVLLQEARMSHSYPHCWRHKTPIIFVQPAVVYRHGAGRPARDGAAGDRKTLFT